MRRRKQEPELSNPNRWIITYADLCTLLMTFFVLLVSMSSLDSHREKKALESLAGSLGALAGGRSTTGKPVEKQLPETTILPSGQALDLKMLREMSVNHNLEPEGVRKEKDRIVISIGQKLLFKSGSTELLPDISNYLVALAKHLSQSDKEIELRGHTDPYEGLNKPQWPEHSWELSAKRAQAVLEFLRERGIDVKRMSAHGFSYYRPLIDSREYPQLSEKNQRVEIVVGPNTSLPREGLRERRGGHPYFNYKNFFFRLYPMPENTLESQYLEKVEDE
jgi:chemotaxis protein MotB